MYTFQIIGFFALMLILSLPNASTAQDTISVESTYEDEYEEWETEPVGMLFSLDFNASVPLFQTFEQLSKPVFGFNSVLLYQFKKELPLFTGIAFSIGRYENEYVEYYDFTEFEENLFKESTSAFLMHIDLKARYFPAYTIWILEPFVDLSIGARNSFALTKVTNVDYDENVLNRLEDSDWGLGYGAGIGTLINIDDESKNFFGHFSINFVSGQNSFMYLKKDDAIGTEDPIDRFKRKSIPFRYLKIDTGIIIYF